MSEFEKLKDLNLFALIYEGEDLVTAIIDENHDSSKYINLRFAWPHYATGTRLSV